VSPKLPPLDAKAVGKLLLREGFSIVSQRGSHAKYRDASGRMTIVPTHQGEEIGPGLLLKILNDAGIAPDSLRR
jgi:predicted RNA binding protein YcfA (HicA-like mRNA interferase family)